MNSVHCVWLYGVGRNGPESGSESQICRNKPDQILGSAQGDTQAQCCQQEDLKVEVLNWVESLNKESLLFW